MGILLLLKLCADWGNSVVVVGREEERIKNWDQGTPVLRDLEEEEKPTEETEVKHYCVAGREARVWYSGSQVKKIHEGQYTWCWWVSRIEKWPLDRAIWM